MIFLRGVNLQLIAGGKGFGNVAQGDAVLRTFWPCEACLNGAHIQFQRTGKYRLVTRVTPHALRFGVGLNESHLLLAATTEAHILQRNAINREKAAGRAIFRRHVGDGGPVRQRQGIQTIAIKFNEFTHHTMLTQHLGDRQNQIRGGDAFGQFTGQLKAHHIGNEH